MIQMPRRSVTRFFIPLIDVLLLLFCIFLLMPIASETELEDKRDSLAEQTESTEVLERELERRTKELREFESLRPKLEEVAKLQQEIDRLRIQSRLDVRQRTVFQIIDVDGKTGEISFYDPSERAPLAVRDQRTAELLIERHQREAGTKELFYHFLYPRPETGYPTEAQERQYREWFAKVAHSLQEARP